MWRQQPQKSKTEGDLILDILVAVVVTLCAPLLALRVLKCAPVTLPPQAVLHGHFLER